MALENKTIVVTGANKGLGAEWVKQLAQRPGNTVIAAVRDPARAQALTELGPNVKITTLDVSDEKSVHAWADSLDSHIDVVVNNAGIGSFNGVDNTDSADFAKIYLTNTIGPFLVVQALHKRGLIGGEGGPTLVANISSTMGSVGDHYPGNGAEKVGIPSGGAIAYRASKSALNSVVKTLSHDLASEGIVSTALCPGFVNTDMTGHNALIDTETSVKGQIKVLETEENLQGTFHYYDGSVISW